MIELGLEFKKKRKTDMKEDNFLSGRIEDNISKCRNKYIVTSTGFLDQHQQSLARTYCRKNFVPVFDECPAYGEHKESSGEWEMKEYPPARTVFYGGYEDAERVIMINLPDYATIEQDNPLTVLRVTRTPGGKELTHRDYLGALLGLGLKRDSFGDILVREDGADIIALKEIADFVLMNYIQVGRTSISVTEVPIGELIIPEVKRREIVDTVASLRLDNVVSSAFGLSRGKSSEAISRGLVFVNHMQIMKADYQIKEEDKIVLRGKGKACLREIRGKSRKDRQYIVLEIY